MRKVVEVQITEEGRDHGKVFVLTEMPCTQAERWATRALLAMARGGADMPENLQQLGALGFARATLQMIGHMRMEDVEPLMNEMFTCVKLKPSPMEKPHLVRPLMENDIEEIVTRLRLRAELLTLHTGFSIPGVESTATPGLPTQYLPHPQ